MSVGIIGIIIEGRENSVAAVNAVLTKSADKIVARMGVPRGTKSIITIILEESCKSADVLVAALKKIDGVSVISCFNS